MADSNIEIYTLQIKRIVHALKNLDEGIDQCKEFSTIHSIDSKLGVSANLPKDFVATDYGDITMLQDDIKALLLKYGIFQQKFEAFNEPNILDPLNMLGKKFWMQGTEKQVTR